MHKTNTKNGITHAVKTALHLWIVFFIFMPLHAAYSRYDGYDLAGMYTITDSIDFPSMHYNTASVEEAIAMQKSNGKILPEKMYNVFWGNEQGKLYKEKHNQLYDITIRDKKGKSLSLDYSDKVKRPYAHAYISFFPEENYCDFMLLTDGFVVAFVYRFDFKKNQVYLLNSCTISDPMFALVCKEPFPYNNSRNIYNFVIHNTLRKSLFTKENIRPEYPCSSRTVQDLMIQLYKFSYDITQENITCRLEKRDKEGETNQLHLFAGKINNFEMTDYGIHTQTYLTEGTVRYNAENMRTFSDTPWVSEMQDINKERIEIVSEKEPLYALIFANGFYKKGRPDLFFANNRVKEIEIIYAGHEDSIRHYVTFPDTTAEQLVPLLYTDCKAVSVKILSVYRGTKYNDTCINCIKPLSEFTDVSVNSSAIYYKSYNLAGMYTITDSIDFPSMNYDITEQEKNAGTNRFDGKLIAGKMYNIFLESDQGGTYESTYHQVHGYNLSYVLTIADKAGKKLTLDYSDKVKRLYAHAYISFFPAEDYCDFMLLTDGFVLAYVYRFDFKKNQVYLINSCTISDPMFALVCKDPFPYSNGRNIYDFVVHGTLQKTLFAKENVQIWYPYSSRTVQDLMIQLCKFSYDITRESITCRLEKRDRRYLNEKNEIHLLNGKITDFEIQNYTIYEKDDRIHIVSPEKTLYALIFANNRVKEIEIIYAGHEGSIRHYVTFPDTAAEQLVPLLYTDCKTVSIKIFSVYSGSSLNDTRINFIKPLSEF